MGTTIKEIKLINFKRFKKFSLKPKRDVNVLVGDNEVGKSTILNAIDLVACGSIRRIESIGVDRLLNVEAVNEFLASPNRSFSNLPSLIVELYLEGDFDFSMRGKNNTKRENCDGIRLVCSPNSDYQNEITEILNDSVSCFPFDYYSVRFSTFADECYSNYRKKLKISFIDSSSLNSTYATADFVRRMYLNCTSGCENERLKHKDAFRRMRKKFQEESFAILNRSVEAYQFGLRTGGNLFEEELMLFEDDISLDCKGKGSQIYIKTDFVLSRMAMETDVVLIEEPESHLSPNRLRELVWKISSNEGRQLFISTHNSYICSRLELRNLFILSADPDVDAISLDNLNDDTAKFFVKAPHTGIIEFILSKKVLLVEGPSEYLLMEKFYEMVSGHSCKEDNVSIFDVRGLSFKRYLAVAKLARIKVAVVTDNDGNSSENCVEKYSEYESDTIKVFFDDNDSNTTFEMVLYQGNKDLCNSLFGGVSHMLSNKTDSAYILLSQNESIVVPRYIMEAVNWIKD